MPRRKRKKYGILVRPMPMVIAQYPKTIVSAGQYRAERRTAVIIGSFDSVADGVFDMIFSFARRNVLFRISQLYSLQIHRSSPNVNRVSA